MFCVFQNCGVQSEELGKVLRLLGLKKKRLVNVLPLLEFITWSLLKEDDLVRSPVQATSCKKKKKKRTFFYPTGSSEDLNKIEGCLKIQINI